MTDSLDAEIERALLPGRFISSRGSTEFIEALEGVVQTIRKLVKPDAARAVRLLETLIGACFEKAEEVHDEGGWFSTFVQDVFCSWIRARAAAGSDRVETARRLLAFGEKDEYCLCYQMERNVVKAFDKAGLSAFEQVVRERMEKAPGRRAGPSFARRRATEMLRAIYTQQRNVPAYIAICEKDPSTTDCLAIATMLRREPQEALTWVEKGLALGRERSESCAAYDLTKLRRELLTRLGRGGDALADAWSAFENYPSKYSYEELQRYVPKEERATWHEKAMNVATGADLGQAIDLLLETRETSRLTDRLAKATDQELEDLSHYTTEPAAAHLEKDHPAVAARLHRALALRILNARKSKYYAAALTNLERAKTCFQRAGKTDEWTLLLASLRKDHSRKIWFIQQLEKLEAGLTEPTFLERVRRRWTSP